MHDVLLLSVPLVVILAGILLGRHDVHQLRNEMRADIKDLRAEMLAEFGKVHSDLRMFYSITGELKGRIDSIEKR